MAMTDQREVVPGRYSVTEIIKPLRQIYLNRRVENYIDPEKTIYLINGTAIHGVLEDGAKNIIDRESHEVEVGFTEEILPGYTLSGRPDYYDVKKKVLWDFKNSKAFTVKKIKNASERMPWTAEDYFIQANVYRAYKYPEAKELKLYFIVQGWTRKEELSPIEQVNVPMGSIEAVRLWVVDRFKHIRAIEEGVIELPLCPKEDLWIRADGTPVRCKEYCSALTLCDQAKRLLK